METIVLFLIIVYIAASIFIQKQLDKLYTKYTGEEVKINTTMNDFIAQVLKDNKISNVQVLQTDKLLNDNYNLKTKTIQLSKEQLKTNLSSLTVSMHECGHALQDHNGYGLLKMRNFFFKPFNLICYISLFLITVGFLVSPIMWKLGVALILLYSVFQLVTVNIEIDASKRAIAIIQEKNILNNTQLEQMKKLLNLSALNYVFSMFSGLINLIR